MLKAPVKLAGKKCKCPKCGAIFTIPEHTPSVSLPREQVNSLPREQVDALRKEKDELLRHRFLFAWSSFSFILLGVILLPITTRLNSPLASAIPWFVFVVGACLGAKYKGQSIFWGLTTLACCVGGIVVAFLPDVGRIRVHEITNTLDKHLAQEDLRNERDRILVQRQSNQLFSFVVGLPGVMLTIGVTLLALPPDPTRAQPMLGLLGLIGVIFLCVGVALAANYRGRSAFWGFAAIPCLLGVLILVIVTDFNKERLKQLDQLIGDKKQ